MTELYPKVKELILYGEENDPENRTHLQTINELRNAMDHLMRVFAYKFGFKPDESQDYATKHIDKAFGHVYRAGYDALDWVSITLRERIVNELNGISHEAIAKIFPEYYREIKPELERASEEISKLRSGKDVAGHDAHSNSFNNFEQYVAIIGKLRDYLDKVLNIKPSLIEYDEERKKSEQKSRLFSLLKVIIGTIIGTIIGFALCYFYTS